MKFLRVCLFVLAAGLIFSSCEKDLSSETGIATGTLKDDGSGDCLPVTVNGTYTVGTAMTSANSVDLQVLFSTAGVYSIKSDTINGYYFTGIGTADATGLVTVHLSASGTPASLGTGVDIFHITYGTSSCAVNVVLGAGGGGGGGTVPPLGTITYKIGTVTTNLTITTATYDGSGGIPSIDLFGFDAVTGASIELYIENVSGSTVAAGNYRVDQTTNYTQADYTNSAAVDFNAQSGSVIGNPAPIFSITLANAVTGPSGTVSGQFSGALKESGGTTVTIDSGAFNLTVN